MLNSPLPPDFWVTKRLIGMVHLPSLPGSPGYNGEPMSEILKRAVDDAVALEQGGADAIMIENFNDVPFAKDNVPPHTLAAMTLAVSSVRSAVGLPLGVNVLRNDALGALAIAHVCGAQFVRVNVWVGATVTDQGIIEGAARKAILYRKELGANVAIFADVFVKHGVPLGGGTLEDAACDARKRGKADALIISGSATGSATSLEDARRVKAVLPDTPLLIGSGFGLETAAALLNYADGAIVGTSLKRNGKVSEPVEVERVLAIKQAMVRTSA